MQIIKTFKLHLKIHRHFHSFNIKIILKTDPKEKFDLPKIMEIYCKMMVTNELWKTELKDSSSNKLFWIQTLLNIDDMAN